MLFSATMNEKVDELIKLSADSSTQQPATLTQEVVRIRPEGNPEAVLLALCSKTYRSQVIIFTEKKLETHRLKILFGLVGLKAAELHGKLTQAQRFDALEAFRKKEVDFLIATDVAARGLDIIGVETVINFQCPEDLTSYVHRVGRTARAGKAGYVVSFVTDDDRDLQKAIRKKVGMDLKRRTVNEQSVNKWSQRIELLEEREEKAMIAEMEAMIAEMVALAVRIV